MRRSRFFQRVSMLAEGIVWVLPRYAGDDDLGAEFVLEDG